jgi:hypothetical protein
MHPHLNLRIEKYRIDGCVLFYKLASRNLLKFLHSNSPYRLLYVL